MGVWWLKEKRRKREKERPKGRQWTLLVRRPIMVAMGFAPPSGILLQKPAGPGDSSRIVDGCRSPGLC